MRDWLKQWIKSRRSLFLGIVQWRGYLKYHHCKIYFPKRSSIVQTHYDHGEYERENVAILSALAQPGKTYFDVGANIGLMAVPILAAHDDIRAVSFEPSPSTVGYLKKTRALSRFADRWTVVDKALGQQTGTATFFTATGTNAVLDGLRDTGRIGDMKEITVSLSTLDAEWEQLGRPKISHIKIDVEGAETEVLAGAAQCIAANRPALFLEWTMKNLKAFAVEPDKLLEIARELNYDLHSAPTLLKVESALMLKLEMAKTESFLLLPRLAIK